MVSGEKVIVIIGGGLSSLVCARKLKHNLVHLNSKIIIIESDDRLGGRMYSKSGIDLGAAWCWKSHDKALVKLAKELSIGIEPQYYNGLAVIQDSNGMLQYRQDISPSGEGSFRFPNGTNSVIQKLENEILNQNMDVNADMCESENGEMTILNPCEIKLCHKVVRIVKLNPNSSSNIENYPRYMISTVYQNNNADMNLNLKADVVIFAMPPKNIGEIHLEPALPPNRMQAMANTPIWMSGTGKVVFIYNKPFWRENGFSGTVFSHTGPLVQIWDSCGKQGDEEVYALSSFIFDNFDLLSNSNDGSMSQDEVLCSRSPIMTQMVNIFGEQAGNPIKMHYKVWELNPKPDPSSYELPFGSPLISAPHEGLIFSGTETVFKENGHMNGAVLAGERAATEAIQYLKKIIS